MDQSSGLGSLLSGDLEGEEERDEGEGEEDTGDNVGEDVGSTVVSLAVSDTVEGGTVVEGDALVNGGSENDDQDVPDEEEDGEDQVHDGVASGPCEEAQKSEGDTVTTDENSVDSSQPGGNGSQDDEKREDLKDSLSVGGAVDEGVP